jgi:hypothetical protein
LSSAKPSELPVASQGSVTVTLKSVIGLILELKKQRPHAVRSTTAWNRIW